jgi:hypothetical protein
VPNRLPPEIAAVEDWTVMALAAELARLLFTGVTVEGVVIVPPLTIVNVPEMEVSSEVPPILPLMRDKYKVLPLPAGLLMRTEMIAEVRLSTMVAEFEALAEYNTADSEALISGGALMSGARKVLVIST